MTGPASVTAAALQRRMELAVGALRGITLCWAAVVCAIDASSGVLDRPEVAFILLAILAAWSAVWTIAVGRRDRWISGPGAAVDTGLAVLAVVADQIVYSGIHPQSFASAWPLCAVVATGIAVGPGAGLAAGTIVGAAGMLAAGFTNQFEGRVLAMAGTLVLLAAAGWVAGWVAGQLRRTAEVASAAAARAEVARTLHDGVLQTLAVIQRRSDDQGLVMLAREQDAELRSFLRGDSEGSPDDAPVNVPGVLGEALAQVESRHGIITRMVVIDPGSATGTAAESLARAATEAAVNAAKHSGAREVWVSVDVRSPTGTTVVVHDEGVGFDPAQTLEGAGITGSMRQRMEGEGGGVSIVSAPGAGTDVTLWVP